MITARDVLDIYRREETINKTAKKANLSTSTVRKILITNGIFVSERSRMIRRMMLSGYSAAETAEQLHISQKAVEAHMPYTKGSYTVDIPTDNALRIRKSRQRKRTAAE